MADSDDEPKVETPSALLAAGSSEEDEEPKMTQDELDKTLLQGVKEDDLEKVKEFLALQAQPSYEQDGWNALLWAARNGNEEIVRTLISYGAHSQYLNAQADSNKKEGDQEEEKKDAFQKPQDASKTGKYTPLHWASYNGHHKVVWILLKENLSPTEIDMYGNTCVHQAAAGGTDKVLKCFLMRGVDVNQVNARSHSPLDLATNESTRMLIQKAMNTERCKGTVCGNSVFDFKNIRYFCESCEQFYCSKCSSRAWVFETKTSQTKERLVCRCYTCSEDIDKYQDELQKAIETHDFHTVHNIFQEISKRKIDIDVMMLNEAEILDIKLDKELDIRVLIKSLAHVDDYKKIRKSANTLLQKVADAQALNVHLDEELMEEVNQCHARLLSERDLRNEMEVVDVPNADSKKIEELQRLIQDASDKSVEDEYLKRGTHLSGQMQGNLQAREVLQLLVDYPIREYPEVEIEDPKKKQKKDEKKKKKKRKEPPFPLPDWAVELDAVRRQIQLVTQLNKNAKDLMLDQKFMTGTKEQLERFKKEISYRQQLEDEAALEAELRALKKKQKKKK